MSKPKKFLGLPPETIIEVVRVNVKTGKHKKKEMTYSDFLTMEKLSGFNYIPYQLGFSQFITKK